MALRPKQQQEHPDIWGTVSENLKVVFDVRDSSVPQQELLRAEKTLGNRLENMTCS